MQIAGTYGNSAALSAFVPEVASQLLAERREVRAAVKVLNESAAFGPDSEITFYLDRESRRVVIKVVDRDSREVIRQIPSDLALELARISAQKR